MPCHAHKPVPWPDREPCPGHPGSHALAIPIKIIGTGLGHARVPRCIGVARFLGEPSPRRVRTGGGIYPDLIGTPPPLQPATAARRRIKPCNAGIDAHHLPGSQSVALRQPGVPSMFDSLEVKVLYPT